MEFDKSKVYTALNADELKVGSKGYFSDTIAGLKIQVKEDCELHTLETVFNEKHNCRFGDIFTSHNLFYLVDEPEERKFRPHKDTDEMIEDFKKRFNVEVPAYSMPLIWVKNAAGAKKLIATFGDDFVVIGGTSHTMEALLESYTYLDGSFCGVEE